MLHANRSTDRFAVLSGGHFHRHVNWCFYLKSKSAASLSFGGKCNFSLYIFTLLHCLFGAEDLLSEENTKENKNKDAKSISVIWLQLAGALISQDAQRM